MKTEDHWFKKNLNWITTAVLTAFLVITGVMQWISYEHNLNMEKYRETRSICQEYIKWFYEPDTTVSMSQLKLWEQYEGDDWIGWDSLGEAGRLEELCHNAQINTQFNYFEDAKVLHKKGLLDKVLFYNFFHHRILRLERASNPNVDEFLKEMRNKRGNRLVYDGYEYCRDTIIGYYRYLNNNQRLALDHIKQNKQITVEEYIELRNSTDSVKCKQELYNMVKAKDNFGVEVFFIKEDTINGTIVRAIRL